MASIRNNKTQNSIHKEYKQMAIRKSEALWQGSLKDGKGTMIVGEVAQEFPFTYASRFEEGDGSNPEELVGAAHAGCFSMFLSALLSADGHAPVSVHTVATVHLDRIDGAPTIHTIELVNETEVAGVTPEEFSEYAEKAKIGCPVSRALASVNTIELTASLKK